MHFLFYSPPSVTGFLLLLRLLHNAIIIPALSLPVLLLLCFSNYRPFPPPPPSLPSTQCRGEKGKRKANASPYIYLSITSLLHSYLFISRSCSSILWVYRVPATSPWETEARLWKLSASITTTLFQNATRTLRLDFLAGNTRQRLRSGSAPSASRTG